MRQCWDMGYLTNGTTQDGFGARTQRAINAMALSFYLIDKFNADLEYVHTPLAIECFGEDFRTGEKARAHCGRAGIVTREGYIEQATLWDNRLCYSGKTLKDIDPTGLHIIDTLDYDKSVLYNDIKRGETDNKLYVVKYLHKEFGDRSIDTNIIDTYYQDIINSFGFTPVLRDNNIEIHIRRSDANPMRSRFLDDKYYLEILQSLIPYRDKYEITIHTQRQGFKAKRYSGWDIIYDDEENDFDLFIKMACAKYLVVGKSSFSIAAAFLNPNTIIYPPQPTIGLSRWINKDDFIKGLK